MRLLSVGELLASGALPDDLREIAIDEWAAAQAREPSPSVSAAQAEYDGLSEKPTKKQRAEADARAQAHIEKLAAINRHIVSAALIAPKLTPDDLADPAFPYADLAMLARILQRDLQFDAAGRRIGVEPLETFRLFAQEHGCVEGCEHCEESRRQLSSVHVGAL
jgi:hypothetical protein